MIEILLSVCLIDQPWKCKDEHLTYTDGISTHQCMLFSQAEIAKWAEGHPKWKVNKWKCQIPGQVAKI